MKKTLNLNDVLPENVTFWESARKDFFALSPSSQPLVLKAIQKVAENPKPSTEGGYGKPLGNMSGLDLRGLLKVKLKKLGIRIVYQYIRSENGMDIVVIGMRADNEIYEEAAKRISR